MKYLGVDWGLKKIGLAYSEGDLASPFLVVPIKSFHDGIQKVLEIAKRECVELIIVGHPEGKMGKVVSKVEAVLKKAGLNVFLTDETLSTQEAKQFSIKTGIGKKARRKDDALSAAIILQRYLDEKK